MNASLKTSPLSLKGKKFKKDVAKKPSALDKLFGSYGVGFVVTDRSPTDKDTSVEWKAMVAIANKHWAKMTGKLEMEAANAGVDLKQLAMENNCGMLVCGCGKPTRLGRSAGRNKIKETPAYIEWEKAGGHASGKVEPQHQYQYELNPNYMRWYYGCGVDKQERSANCKGVFIKFLDQTNMKPGPASPFVNLFKPVQDQELLVDPDWKAEAETFIEFTAPHHTPDWTTRRVTEDTKVGF